MRKFIFILFFVCLSTYSRSQTYFPPKPDEDPLTEDPWNTELPSSLGWCPEKIDVLLKFLEEKNTKAFIVLHKGNIVIEKYFGSFDQESEWYWASAGKTITSFLVGIAQQEGNLSIDDATSERIGTGWTSCAPDKEEKITIRHQLTMTSGLNELIPDHSCTMKACLIYKADAGTRWAYHNGPYTLLDSVIRRATGLTLNFYATQKLKSPIGMKGRFVNIDFDHVFISNARSMARFGLLMLNNGKWGEDQIMTDASYFSQMINSSQTLNNSYGYLWWLNGKSSYMEPVSQVVSSGYLNPSAPADMYAALGKNGQLINIVPSKDLVFIRMGDAPGVGEVPRAFNDTIWKKLNDAMATCVISSVKATHDEFSEIKIFPNPSQNRSLIEIKNQNFDLTIYDNLGRIVFEKHGCFDKIEFNSELFINGVYRVEAALDDIVLNQKLIISK
jgi:CubicO group peptidase (beta-lactamase class C family)